MKKFLAICLAVTAFSSQANVITSNASEYFLNLATNVDKSQSTTNTWQIGSNKGAEFSLLDFQDPNIWNASGLVGWFESGFHGGFINTNSTDINYNTQIPAAAGQLILHPGNGGASDLLITLRYLVPETTLFDVSALFKTIDFVRNSNTAQATGVSITIEAAGNIIGFEDQIIGTTFFNPPQPNTYSFEQTGLTLNQGDFIDFVISPNGSFLDDSVSTQVQISYESNAIAVSNPSTSLLIALSLLGLGFLPHKRK